MTIILVKTKYNKKKNAIHETRYGTIKSIDGANKWLNEVNLPAYVYVDGMEDTDQFYSHGTVGNELFYKECEKVID